MITEIGEVAVVILKAIKDSELDCNTWDQEVQEELKTEIIAALQKAGVRFWQE